MQIWYFGIWYNHISFLFLLLKNTISFHYDDMDENNFVTLSYTQTQTSLFTFALSNKEEKNQEKIQICMYDKIMFYNNKSRAIRR